MSVRVCGRCELAITFVFVSVMNTGCGAGGGGAQSPNRVVGGLCVKLWVFFDTCGVASCGFWAGLQPPLGSSEAERSVISEG